MRNDWPPRPLSTSAYGFSNSPSGMPMTILGGGNALSRSDYDRALVVIDRYDRETGRERRRASGIEKMIELWKSDIEADRARLNRLRRSNFALVARAAPPRAPQLPVVTKRRVLPRPRDGRQLSRERPRAPS